MPIDKSLPNPAEALLDENTMWLSPVSNIVQRLSNASFQTPKPKEASVPTDNDDVFADSRPLANDAVKFNFDDSSDSVHQFMQNQPSAANSCDTSLDSEYDILGAQAQNLDTSCRPRALTFAASPSTPSLGNDSGGRCWPRRLLSVPIGASSPTAARRRQRAALRSAAKRPSPDGQEQLEQQEQQAKSLTPKRQRLERPLADISNGARTTQQKQQRQQQQKPLPLARCMSELSALSDSKLDSAKIDKAIASIDSLNLIGNSQQRHSLPTVKEHGRHYGIPYVTPETVGRLLDGRFQETTPSYRIIDCRYPYEYGGGHIRDAVNIFTREQLLESVLLPTSSGGDRRQKPALIFHCEFSSQRAPKLAGFLRDQDRLLNSNNYPNLYFPEVYVLQGGYKAFFDSHKAECEPQHYTKMVDPKHREQLAQYERQGKAWERQNSRSKQTQLQRLVRRQ